jgi:phospholipid transport system substrate-binding protein
MKNRAWTIPLVALAVSLSLVADASAGAAADRLRQFFNAANAAIADPATADRPAEKLEAVRRLARDLFDHRDAAERALGAEWQARTPAEREEFATLFGDFVESSFVTAVASRARLDGGASVTVLDEMPEGEGAATVRTTVAGRTGDDIAIDYRMLRRGARWTVRDVVIDGVSVVDNYRAQMRRMIDRSSYAALVAEMRSRTGRPAPALGTVASAPSDGGPSGARPPVAVAATLATPERRAVRPVVIASAAPFAEAPRLAAIEEPAALQSAPAPAAVTPPAPTTIAPAPVAPASPPAFAPAPTTSARLRATTAPAPSGGHPEPEARPSAARPASPPAATPTVKTASIARASAPAVGLARSFWVQVGAFHTPEALVRMATRLGNRPLAVRASPAPEPVLRLLIGPFSARAEAAVALRALQALGYRGFLAEDRD